MQSVDLEVRSETSNSDEVSTGKEDSAISKLNWLNLAAYGVNTVVTYTSLAGLYGATNTELSQKYQTLVTPAGWAFSIWGPIFIWEGVFVVAQFFPQFRQSDVTRAVSPWWWALCAAQSFWTLAFAQDVIPLALILMLSILVTLLGISWCTDGQQMSTSEYLLLRAPFSLQLGWIVAASVLNMNVQADAAMASQETLLGLAIVSHAIVLAVVSFFTFAVKSPDAIVGFVAAWAFGAICSELGNATLLNDPTRFNPIAWDPVVLGGVRKAALIVSLLSLALALVATAIRIFRFVHSSEESDTEA